MALHCYLGHGASGTSASMQPFVDGLRARGIERLIAHVRAVVETKTGVALEAEVRMLGEPAGDGDFEAHR